MDDPTLPGTADPTDAYRDAVRDGLLPAPEPRPSWLGPAPEGSPEPHPSHPRWWWPPIPAPPVLCEWCGIAIDADDIAEPCPGPREPSDDDIARMADAPSDHERHAAAWHEHQEAHR